MDYLTKFLNRIKQVKSDKHEPNENIFGPTIGISPGQVKEDVHYMESRGAIDLSNLRFYADDNPKNVDSQSDYDGQGSETINEEEETYVDDFNFNGESHVGGIESFVDIAVFEVPEHCTSRNCDLSRFGVGSLTHFNGASYLNLCQAGRLQLDYNIFEGHHTQLMVPREGPMPDRILKKSKFSMPKNRHYEVMLANCHENGRRVHVVGQVVFDLVDDDAAVNNLTAQSLTILISVAFAVFATLTLLAIRVNWGTRSDFEQERYRALSGNDGDEQEDLDGENEEGDNEIDVSEENPEMREPMALEATIV